MPPKRFSNIFHDGVLTGTVQTMNPRLDSQATCLAAAPEFYVDADEVSAFLKIDRRTAIRWAREGRIPAHPLRYDGKRKTWRFLLSELDQWMRSRVNSACRPCPASGRIN